MLIGQNLLGLQITVPTYFEPGDVGMLLVEDIYGSFLTNCIVNCIESGQERPTAHINILADFVTPVVRANYV